MKILKSCLLCLAMAGLGLSGCASGLPKAEQPEAEKSELARLKAENTRLEERVDTLELRLKDAEAHGTEDRDAPRPSDSGESEGGTLSERAGTDSDDSERDLPVVRLTPHSARSEGDEGAPATSSGKNPLVVASGSSARVDHLEPEAASKGPIRLEVVGDAGSPEYDQGVRAFEDGDYRKARDLFSRFLRSSSRHPFSDNALFYRGQCASELGDLKGAVADLKKVVTEYPEDMVTPDVWIALAEVQEKQGDEASARKSYQTVQRRFADSTAAARIPAKYQP